ncbi:MAG: HemK family protein methyltransferase [Candidatus Onthovivens sp.]|nr:HemK family protein methyltransferase [Candidatus Onthovivens sp.]
MPLSNREAFYKAKKLLQLNNSFHNDSEIYSLLIKANDFSSFTEIIVNFEKNLAKPQYFYRKLKKLISGIPLYYVLEEAPFLGENLFVNESVLIPRPETEELCIKCEKLIKDMKFSPTNIAEICTGSGCIATYFKKKFRESNVYAIDKYTDALEVCRKNAEILQTDLIILRGDKTEPLLKRNLKIDLLISNPPYVENINDIEENVKKYEPMHAIYSKDGTAFYEDYFKKANDLMNKKFIMAFEINFDQEEKLTFLINKYFNLNNISFKFEKDQFGLTRFLFIFGGL